jgi:hypothetical protein
VNSKCYVEWLISFTAKSLASPHEFWIAAFTVVGEDKNRAPPLPLQFTACLALINCNQMEKNQFK